MSANKIGAPDGGRVYWLMYELRVAFGRDYWDFTENYSISFSAKDPGKHCYFFERIRKKRRDMFIVIRTSAQCYRVVYFDTAVPIFEYNSFVDATSVAQYVANQFRLKTEREVSHEKWLESEKLRKESLPPNKRRGKNYSLPTR